VRDERDDQLQQLQMKIPFSNDRAKTCCARPILDGNLDRISETFTMRRGEKGRGEDLLLLNLIENLMLSQIEKKRTVGNEVELRSPESARTIKDL
jgi:hypothetical protein